MEILPTQSNFQITVQDDPIDSPFLLIRNLVKDVVFWDGFLNESGEFFVHRKMSVDADQTSCLFNYFALSTLFLGKERAKKVHDRLKGSQSITITVRESKKTDFEKLIKRAKKASRHPPTFTSPLVKTAKGYPLEIYMIPGGYHIAENEWNIENDRNFIINFANEHFANLHDKQSRQKLLDYNTPVIQKMYDETLKNQSIVDSKTSYIYQVIISAPLFDTFMLEKEVHHDSCFSFYHCFLIEQYLSVGNDVHYRLHQAWAKAMNLDQFYTDRCYDDKDKGTFDRTQFETFLSHLKVLVCPTTHPLNPEERHKVEKECFFVANNDFLPPPLAFNNITQTISGLSIRFLGTPVNKEECAKNIREIYSNSKSHV